MFERDGDGPPETTPAQLGANGDPSDHSARLGRTFAEMGIGTPAVVRRSRPVARVEQPGRRQGPAGIVDDDRVVGVVVPPVVLKVRRHGLFDHEHVTAEFEGRTRRWTRYDQDVGGPQHGAAEAGRRATSRTLIRRSVGAPCPRSGLVATGR